MKTNKRIERLQREIKNANLSSPDVMKRTVAFMRRVIDDYDSYVKYCRRPVRFSEGLPPHRRPSENDFAYERRCREYIRAQLDHDKLVARMHENRAKLNRMFKRLHTMLGEMQFRDDDVIDIEPAKEIKALQFRGDDVTDIE